MAQLLNLFCHNTATPSTSNILGTYRLPYCFLYLFFSSFLVVSAPAHGIHPPKKLLFFSPKIFRRILRVSQKGSFWLRGREPKSEPWEEKESLKVSKGVSEKDVWGSYEATNALSLRECGKEWNRWQRVSDYFREIERD